VGLVDLVVIWILPLPRMRAFEHVSFVASLAAMTLTTAPLFRHRTNRTEADPRYRNLWKRVL
jgi:hypothetical protein